MKSFLLTLLLGIVIGAGGMWYYLVGRPQPPPATTAQPAASDAAASARAKEVLDSKLEVLGLKAEAIKEELARTGQVARRKTGELGEAIKDATADARITATTKAKLLKDPQLSAWDISVNTTDGRVTLAGSVSSPELIGRAILLAYETDGVREVVATLRVKANNG